MSNLAELLERVRAATGPDRELDAALCAHFRVLSPAAERERWAREWKGAIVPHGPGCIGLAHSDGSVGMHCEARPLTASLDAAMELVEREFSGGFGWWVEMETAGMGAVLRGPDGEEFKGGGVGKDLPSAVLAALLSALIAEDVGSANPERKNHAPE